MVSASKSSHIGSSLSVIDILAVLYGGVANIDPSTVESDGRDFVIVSKGHAAAGTYAVLAVRGFFPTERLRDYCSDGQPLSGHVTAGQVPGIEFSTGSLGHGLGLGVGVALADQSMGRTRRVFVIMSDGECDEGSVWEAALIAAHYQLEQLTAIIDRNYMQALGPTEDVLGLEPLRQKWESFGWAAFDVDGHDHVALEEALRRPTLARPTLVIAHTTKGHGVTFMENQIEWHYRAPNDEDLLRALLEIEDHDA